MLYLSLKALRIFAVVIFLGNIITGLFWHMFAAWPATEPDRWTEPRRMEFSR